MTKQDDKDEVKTAEVLDCMVYERPVLSRFGKLGDLTGGSPGPGSDGGAFGASPPVS